MKGRSDLVLRLEFIKKAIAFAILFVSMLFNLTVMCYGLVLYSVIAAYLNSFYTNRILGYAFSRQIKSILPYFIFSLVILAEALLSTRFIENSLVSLLVSLTVCPLTYYFLARWSKVYAYQEAVELVRAKLRK